MKSFMLDLFGSFISFLIDVYDYFDDTPDEEESYEYKIWGVVDGPFNREDFPEEELAGTDVPLTATTMLVVKIEEKDGSIGTVNLWFDTFNEAYDIKNHFEDSIDPILMS